uniref:Uncharacterized protein n=1 Tax=Strombidium inclinatum TaxID=197538 RepID=A0A7S3IL43_9SPIT
MDGAEAEEVLPPKDGHNRQFSRIKEPRQETKAGSVIRVPGSQGNRTPVLELGNRIKASVEDRRTLPMEAASRTQASVADSRRQASQANKTQDLEILRQARASEEVNKVLQLASAKMLEAKGSETYRSPKLRDHSDRPLEELKSLRPSPLQRTRPLETWEVHHKPPLPSRIKEDGPASPCLTKAARSLTVGGVKPSQLNNLIQLEASAASKAIAQDGHRTSRTRAVIKAVIKAGSKLNRLLVSSRIKDLARTKTKEVAGSASSRSKAEVVSSGSKAELPTRTSASALREVIKEDIKEVIKAGSKVATRAGTKEVATKEAGARTTNLKEAKEVI